MLIFINLQYQLLLDSLWIIMPIQRDSFWVCWEYDSNTSEDSLQSYLTMALCFYTCCSFNLATWWINSSRLTQMSPPHKALLDHTTHPQPGTPPLCSHSTLSLVILYYNHLLTHSILPTRLCTPWELRWCFIHLFIYLLPIPNITTGTSQVLNKCRLFDWTITTLKWAFLAPEK